MREEYDPVIKMGLDQIPTEGLHRILKVKRMLLDGGIYDTDCGKG